MARPSSERWSGPSKGAASCRPPVVPRDLEPLELDGLEDDDGWVERDVRGSAIGADAERVGFTRCVVTGVRFSAARLHRWDLTDVRFVDCDLANAVIEEATFVRVVFERCRFIGADLGGATLTDVRFVDCQLDDTGLRMVQAARLEVDGGSAQRLDLYRARVPGSAWLGTDLTGADLSGADLARARLHRSTLADVRGASALKGTFIGPDQEVAVGLALIADADITVVDEDDHGG